MSTEIVHIPFHGDEVLAVEIDGVPHVLLKPVLESIGLNVDTQIEKLKTRSWSNMRLWGAVAADGKHRMMQVVDLRTLSMMLANINENNIPDPVVRAALIRYQSEVADTVLTHFTTGSDLIPAPKTYAEALRQLADRVESEQKMALALVEEAQARQVAEAVVEDLRPKGEAYDNFLTAGPGGNRLVREVAKEFGIKSGKFWELLLDNSILFRKEFICGAEYYDFYAQYDKFFKAYDAKIEHKRPEFKNCSHYTLRITPAGTAYLYRRFMSKTAEDVKAITSAVLPNAIESKPEIQAVVFTDSQSLNGLVPKTKSNISRQDVLDIRAARHSENAPTNAQLAAKYKTSTGTISRIVNGQGVYNV